MTKVHYGRPAANRGFTLIEMSIVLVIIGLIIGGILKGQEIIASARAKAVVNQMNALRSAAGTYFDRYRSLPGDDLTGATRVDARLVNGDGNGIVGTLSATDAGGQAVGNAGENFQYFKGLLAANLIGGAEVTPVGTTTSNSFGAGSSLPSSPVSGAGVVVIRATHTGDGDTITTRTAHWYRIEKNPSASAASMSPRELYAVDAQIDDGLPGSGQVRGSTTPACYTAAAGAIYALSDNVTCIAYFEAHQ